MTGEQRDWRRKAMPEQQGNWKSQLAGGSAQESEQSDATSGPKKSQVQVLIETAETEAGLFHTPDHVGFADIIVHAHRETWAIKSTGFRRWLTSVFYRHAGIAPSANAMQTALALLDGLALFEAPERAIYVRTAALGEHYYIDLADRNWRAVEISAGGWRVIESPPVRFRRAAGMQGLPEPIPGGTMDDLREFINVRSADDFVLFVSWLLAALRPVGPYPVLALTGEQGSAKSTLATIARRLSDPNTAPLRSLPRDDRDLFIAASNGHVLCFDNISDLPDWLSDAMCRIATGGGCATRALFTNCDEIILAANRPIILNGIEPAIERADLADRALYLTLDPIPEAQRRTERQLLAAFDARRPSIFGALLDAMVVGLHELPEVRIDRLPRMADFAIWATACEGAWVPDGTFMKAYRANMHRANDEVIEASPVATAIKTLMQAYTKWTGTVGELLKTLNEKADNTLKGSRTWPKTPRGLRGKMQRCAPALRRSGISIEFGGHTESGAQLTIEKPA